MPLSPLFRPLAIAGHLVPNRLHLAPLTNQISPDAGRVSADEHRWLAMRAAGGFGLVSTAAGAVAADGQAFPGQLGFYAEAQLPGLAGMTRAIRAAGGVSLAQLQHGGPRALVGLTGALPVGPSAGDGVRALAIGELPGIVEQFAAAADRADRAGYDGIQLHAAYGFLLARFLDAEANRRSDPYGGGPAGRSRLLREVIAAVRARVRPTRFLSLRLNLPVEAAVRDERLALASELLSSGAIDHVDMIREPDDRLDWLAALDRGHGTVTVTGGFSSAADMEAALLAGADLVGVGTAAILHHDLPRRLLADPRWRAAPLPVTAEHLVAEGVGPAFLSYLTAWPGFVAPATLAA